MTNSLEPETTGPESRYKLAAISCLGAVICLGIGAVLLTLYVLRPPLSAFLPPTATRAPTATLSPKPTFTATSVSAIATPTTTAPAEAATTDDSQWTVILSDAFDSNENGWSDYSFSDETMSITYHVGDGKYMWDVKLLPGSYGVGLWQWPPSSGSVSDFYASVDANVTGQIIDATCGLTFRHNEAGHYFFGVNAQGQFTVVATIYGRSDKMLIKLTETSAFQSGESNRLTVVAVGSHLAFYLKDQLVAELDDETFPSGTVGLMIQLSGEEAQAQVEFDNFELRTP